MELESNALSFSQGAVTGKLRAFLVAGCSRDACANRIHSNADGIAGCWTGCPFRAAVVRTPQQTLPIFVFCFTCHQNIFTICNEIVRPTPGRVDAVIGEANRESCKK